MSVLATSSFAQANQTGWGPSTGGQVWNTSARGSGIYNITSNEGVNSGNGGTFAIARLGSGTATSTGISVRLNPADTTSDIGCIARFVDSNNFYYGVLVGGVARIGKDVANTFTTLASTSVTYSSGNYYWLLFVLSGINLKLKFWADGSVEPSAFTVTTTDSSLSSGGYGLGSDASGSTNFDNLIVTDAPAAVHFFINDGLCGVFS
jgi:hypothetical protein